MTDIGGIQGQRIKCLIWLAYLHRGIDPVACRRVMRAGLLVVDLFLRTLVQDMLRAITNLIFQY